MKLYGYLLALLGIPVGWLIMIYGWGVTPENWAVIILGSITSLMLPLMAQLLVSR